MILCICFCVCNIHRLLTFVIKLAVTLRKTRQKSSSPFGEVQCNMETEAKFVNCYSFTWITLTADRLHQQTDSPLMGTLWNWLLSKIKSFSLSWHSTFCHLYDWIFTMNRSNHENVEFSLQFVEEAKKRESCFVEAGCESLLTFVLSQCTCLTSHKMLI